MTAAARFAVAACLVPLLALSLAACQREPAAATKPAEEAAAPALARISEQAAKTVGIETAIAGPATVVERLPLYGLVKPNAERVREVIARFPGTIRTVTKAIGDTVTRGEIMATIESDQSLETYAIGAPMSGLVTAREADPGEQAAGEVLFSITDLSTVWIELSLFPADAARVHVGQSVLVASVDGSVRANGKIALVGAFGQASTQTLTARVPLDNASRRWTPGLFVNGAVALAESTVPVAIAATAVQTLEGTTVVFVPVEGGYAPRAIKGGRDDGETIEVLDGLAAGEAYVAKNSFIVKAELGKAGLEEDEAGEEQDAEPAK